MFAMALRMALSVGVPVSASFAETNFNWDETSEGLGTTYSGNVNYMNCYGSDWPAYNNGVESFPAHTQGSPPSQDQGLWRDGDTFYGFFSAGFSNVAQGSCGSCVEVEISARAVVGTMVDCQDLDNPQTYKAILQNTDNGIATSGLSYGLPWNLHYDLFLGSTSAAAFNNEGVCSGGNALIKSSKVVPCPKELYCKSGLIPDGKNGDSCAVPITTSAPTTVPITTSAPTTGPIDGGLMQCCWGVGKSWKTCVAPDEWCSHSKENCEGACSGQYVSASDTQNLFEKEAANPHGKRKQNLRSRMMHSSDDDENAFLQQSMWEHDSDQDPDLDYNEEL